MNREISVGQFEEISKQVLVGIEKIQEIMKRHNIKDSVRLYISEDGIYSFEGKGLCGWELNNYSGRPTIEHEYKKVLEIGGDENKNNKQDATGADRNTGIGNKKVSSGT